MRIPIALPVKNYSKAYLHHLIRSGELLGAMVLIWHNTAYFQYWVARMRAVIAVTESEAFPKAFRAL